ncbi:MAG TPA: hypothetical protein VLT33_02920 [Labilithrix sp.]|nr:hypothetical protein [Labilithrix sp.]
MRRATRRALARRHAGGAAYTELLALMPALIVINMALLNLWSAYSAKQYTQHTSRHGAWSPALKGCQGPATVKGATPTAPTPDATLQQLAGQLAQAKQHAAAESLRAPLENLAKQASGARAQGTGKKTESDFGVFASGTYTTAGAVLCNEVPKAIRSADEKRAVDDAWKKYVR